MSKIIAISYTTTTSARASIVFDKHGVIAAGVESNKRAGINRSVWFHRNALPPRDVGGNVTLTRSYKFTTLRDKQKWIADKVAISRGLLASSIELAQFLSDKVGVYYSAFEDVSQLDGIEFQYKGEIQYHSLGGALQADAFDGVLGIKVVELSKSNFNRAVELELLSFENEARDGLMVPLTDKRYWRVVRDKKE